MKITRTQLYLERLELVILIGIHDFEQTRPQRVHVDVEMEVDPADMAFADDLSQGVDYDFVRDGIKQLVAERRYKTQEALCQDILELTLRNRKVRAATVRTRKPDVYADAAAVGCVVSATND